MLVKAIELLVIRYSLNPYLSSLYHRRQQFVPADALKRAAELKGYMAWI